MNHKVKVLLKNYALETGRDYKEIRVEWLRANWRDRTKQRQVMEKAVKEDQD